MKKICVILVSVLLLVSAFSVGANAADETRTEKFFSEIEEKKAATFYEPFKSEEFNGLNIEKISMRIVKDENGNRISELCGSAKLGFMDLKMYALESGIFIYFPQFNRHMDYSFVWKDKTDDLVEIFTGYSEEDIIPIPSYPEYMILKSIEEKEIGKYGKVYVETFSYDIEAVVDDLVSKDIIPDPTLYDISLDDNKALSDFYWNYAGDYSGFASSLLYDNEASFMYNEEGLLVAADYFSGEGKEIDHENYELGLMGGIAPGANEEDFIMPESSANLEIFMMFVKLIFTLLVNWYSFDFSPSSFDEGTFY